MCKQYIAPDVQRLRAARRARITQELIEFKTTSHALDTSERVLNIAGWVCTAIVIIMCIVQLSCN